eukprot:SAG31_NODE_801_length_12013_cov_23.812070_20_plen_131_part_00
MTPVPTLPACAPCHRADGGGVWVDAGNAAVIQLVLQPLQRQSDDQALQRQLLFAAWQQTRSIAESPLHHLGRTCLLAVQGALPVAPTCTHFPQPAGGLSKLRVLPPELETFRLCKFDIKCRSSVRVITCA